MTNTVLQLDNVEFRRNRRVIITDVNLTINAGERWVLFGPNGIGKSTAVGMLATRTFPSEGRVFILGHQLGKYDVFKLRTRIGLASADLGRQFPEFEDPKGQIELVESLPVDTLERDGRHLKLRKRYRLAASTKDTTTSARPTCSTPTRTSSTRCRAATRSI